MSDSRELDAAPTLFCFGLGFSALALARLVLAEGGRVAGTYRDDKSRLDLERQRIETFPYEAGRPVDWLETLASVTDILVSIPPDAGGDPVLRQFAPILRTLPCLRWLGYLSTTGVYGDTGGALVDETAPLRPTSRRGEQRVRAERQWLDEAEAHGLPVHVFRLAGIYGPGRSALDQVRAGTARRVDRPNHLFSRIHVADIARVLRASMARPDPGRIYNVCDDEAAAPSDVIAHACALLGVAPPALVPFATAAASMSPMALSFWRDNRRVDNRRIKRELGVSLGYPTYREGLRAILDAERVASPTDRTEG